MNNQSNKLTRKTWQAHVVVSSVVCRQENGVDKFLLVREHNASGIRINQPAGHWEEGESIIDAVKRETLEESGYEFTPQNFLGIYTINSVDDNVTNVTFLRIAFIGEVGANPVTNKLDKEIIEALWWDKKQIDNSKEMHRSAFVGQMIEDYYQKPHLPLSVINDLL